MNKASRVPSAFSEVALARRRSGRPSTSPLRSSSSRRCVSPTTSGLLGENLGEESDRRNVETSEITFTVKFIGLDLVGGPYEEAECKRTLRRYGRRAGCKLSSPVLLSISSSRVQVIQFPWAVAFEHPVTSVSACYTDLCRTRLFAYVVKDYTTGHHICLAFKTAKSVSGQRLQRAFGYAFDSCGMSSIQSSEEAELERCLEGRARASLQGSGYDAVRHGKRGLLGSNSRFSALSEVVSVGESHCKSTGIQAPSSMPDTPNVHTVNVQSNADTQNREDTVKHSSSGLGDLPVMRRHEEEGESSGVRLTELTAATTGYVCCHCHCHRGTRREIQYSLSDGFLHSMHIYSANPPLKPVLPTQEDETLCKNELISEQGAKLDDREEEQIPTAEDDTRRGENMEACASMNETDDTAGVDTRSRVLQWLESQLEHCNEKDSTSQTVNTLSTGVTLSSSPLPHQTACDESNDNLQGDCLCESTSQELLERQMGYLNLTAPEPSLTTIDTRTELSIIPSAMTSTGFNIHEPANREESAVFSLDALLQKHNNTTVLRTLPGLQTLSNEEIEGVKRSEATTVLNSRAFLPSHTFTSAKLTASVCNSPPGLKPNDVSTVKYVLSESKHRLLLLPTKYEDIPPVLPPQRESLDHETRPSSTTLLNSAQPESILSSQKKSTPVINTKTITVNHSTPAFTPECTPEWMSKSSDYPIKLENTPLEPPPLPPKTYKYLSSHNEAKSGPLTNIAPHLQTLSRKDDAISLTSTSNTLDHGDSFISIASSSCTDCEMCKTV